MLASQFNQSPGGASCDVEIAQSRRDPSDLRRVEARRGSLDTDSVPKQDRQRGRDQLHGSSAPRRTEPLIGRQRAPWPDWRHFAFRTDLRERRRSRLVPRRAHTSGPRHRGPERRCRNRARRLWPPLRVCGVPGFAVPADDLFRYTTKFGRAVQADRLIVVGTARTRCIAHSVRLVSRSRLATLRDQKRWPEAAPFASDLATLAIRCNYKRAPRADDRILHEPPTPHARTSLDAALLARATLRSRGHPSALLNPSTPDTTTLALAHAAPDSELLTIRDGELEAVRTDHTTPTDLLRLPGR